MSLARPPIPYLIAAALLVAAAATAEPFIHQVTGDPVEGATLTISGQNFGAKDPAAPLIDDRLAANDGLLEGDPIPTRDDGCPDCPWQRVLPPDGVRFSTAEPRTPGGAAYRVTDRGRLVFDDLGGATPGKLFVSWWVRPNQDLDLPMPPRLIRVQDRTADPSSRIVWSLAGLTCTPDANHDGTPEEPVRLDPPWDGIAGQWTNLELLVNNGWAVNRGFGRLDTSRDQMIVHHADFWGAGPLNLLAGLGFDHGNQGLPPGFAFDFTDVYVDTTFARVILSDTPTLTGDSQVELQRPLTWSPDEIAVTVVLGTLDPAADLHVFVVDEYGRFSPGMRPGEVYDGPGVPSTPVFSTVSD